MKATEFIDDFLDGIISNDFGTDNTFVNVKYKNHIFPVVKVFFDKKLNTIKLVASEVPFSNPDEYYDYFDNDDFYAMNSSSLNNFDSGVVQSFNFARDGYGLRFSRIEKYYHDVANSNSKITIIVDNICVFDEIELDFRDNSYDLFVDIMPSHNVMKESKKMKTKYTKKQIQESIKYWKKMLESWDDEDMRNERTNIDNFAKYKNKIVTYQPLSKGKLEDLIIEEFIDIRGINTYQELCDEIKNAIESEFDYQLAVTDVTLLGSAHCTVGVATTASGQTLQQINNKLEDIGFDRMSK